MDEIEIQAELVRNKIADFIQNGFAREMNRLVYEEARKCFKNGLVTRLIHYVSAKNHSG